jgi:CBS domain-containing protein
MNERMKSRDVVTPGRFTAPGDFLGSTRRRGGASGMNDPDRSASGREVHVPGATEPISPAPEPFVRRLEGREAAPTERTGAPLVRDIMTTDVRSCRPDRTLVAAAAAMHWGDCRFLPVVDSDRRPIGVVTDGDICLIGTSDQRPLRDIAVSEAMSRDVETCRPEDSVQTVSYTHIRSHETGAYRVWRLLLEN